MIIPWPGHEKSTGSNWQSLFDFRVVDWIKVIGFNRLSCSYHKPNCENVSPQATVSVYWFQSTGTRGTCPVDCIQSVVLIERIQLTGSIRIAIVEQNHTDHVCRAHQQGCQKRRNLCFLILLVQNCVYYSCSSMHRPLRNDAKTGPQPGVRLACFFSVCILADLERGYVAGTSNPAVGR